MVKLSVASTRMKDFYDLQVLSSRLAFDGKTFSEAVRKTFLNRGTELLTNRVPFAFTPEFYDDTNKKRLWTAFCAKNATCMAKTEFNTLIETLKIFLVPVVAAVHERTLFSNSLSLFSFHRHSPLLITIRMTLA
jgi:Nucleotidyl transferase AbiEii toxin, Type IV TA system